jgi:hypothetical protein
MDMQRKYIKNELDRIDEIILEYSLMIMYNDIYQSLLLRPRYFGFMHVIYIIFFHVKDLDLRFSFFIF